MESSSSGLNTYIPLLCVRVCVRARVVTRYTHPCLGSRAVPCIRCALLIHSFRSCLFAPSFLSNKK